MSASRTKFYLDKQNSKWLGVCAGIADYTGIDLTLVGWNGFYAPAGTPQDIITKLNEAGVKALGSPDDAKRLETVASMPMPTTPEQLSELIQRDRAAWKPMVELYDLKVK